MAKSYDRPESDFYPTPDSVVYDLFETVPKLDPYTSGMTYLEPCYGSGKMYRHLPVGSRWAELDMGVDYLNTQFDKVDCIITNPPFSLAKEFLEKSLTEATVVVYLLRLNFLSSQKRKEFWLKNKPTSLAVLSKRPSFTRDGKTDSSDYGWFIFDKTDKLKLDKFYFI